jgi:WD40 repeat protein
MKGQLNTLPKTGSAMESCTTMQPITRKLYRFPIWAVLLLVLSGCAMNTPNKPDFAQTFGASGVAFSPDGKRVAVGTRDRIWVADTVTQETTASLGHSQAAGFGNSKSLHFIDNQRLVVGAQGAIMIWDLKEGLVTDRLPLSSKMYSPKAITWSETTQMLAFSTGASGSSVKLVHIVDSGFGPVGDLLGFKGVPGDLQFSRDGRFLAAAGDGAGVFIREVDTGKAAGELPTDDSVSDLELFGEHQLLVAGTSIEFWTFLDKQELFELDNPDLGGQVTGQIMTRVAGGVALGALTLFMAVLEAYAGGSGEATAQLGAMAFHVASKPVNRSQQPWCGRSTTISPDGRWLADVYPGITKEVIRVYDLESDQTAKKLNPRGEYSCAVRFSPNGKQLLLTTNKVARLYDTKTWRYHDLKLGDSR